MAKEKFAKLSKSVKMLWNLLSGNFPVTSYVIINSYIGQKQSYLGYNFLDYCKKGPKTNLGLF